ALCLLMKFFVFVCVCVCMCACVQTQMKSAIEMERGRRVREIEKEDGMKERKGGILERSTAERHACVCVCGVCGVVLLTADMLFCVATYKSGVGTHTHTHTHTTHKQTNIHTHT